MVDVGFAKVVFLFMPHLSFDHF